MITMLAHTPPKVYAGMDGNNYWSAGPRPPRYKHGNDGIIWEKVESSYPNGGTLWRGTAKE